MKVILLTDLGKLGKEGQTKEVKDGYARNYLIPRKLALGVNEGSLKRFEDIKKAKEKNSQIQKQQFLKTKAEIEKISLTNSLFTVIGRARLVLVRHLKLISRIISNIFSFNFLTPAS